MNKYGMKEKTFKERVNQGIREHEWLLSKQLAYSPDLQNQEMIARYRENIAKLKAML